MTTFIVAVEYLGRILTHIGALPPRHPTTRLRPVTEALVDHQKPGNVRRASASRYRRAAGTAPPSCADVPAAPPTSPRSCTPIPIDTPAQAVPSSHRERRPSAYMKGRVHAHLHPKEHCHAY
jgi:hypothetical protein